MIQKHERVQLVDIEFLHNPIYTDRHITLFLEFLY